MKLWLNLILITSLLWGCDSDSPNGPDPEPDYANITTISYSDHVQKLFDNNCVACHGGNQPAAGLNLSAWQQVVEGSDSGEALIPFASRHSRMIKLLDGRAGNRHPAPADNDTISTAAVNFLARWIDEGAKNAAGEIAFASSRDRVYVCAQNNASVYIIDTALDVVVRRIDLVALGFTADCKPHHVAVEADGSAWYLSLIGDNRVLKFGQNDQLVAQATVISPALLAKHPGESVLYVSRFMAPGATFNSVFALNASDLTAASQTANGEIPVLFQVPHGLALSADGSYAWFLSLAENRLITVDNSTREALDNFLFLGQNKGPLQLSLAPENNRLYITCRDAQHIMVVDVSDPQSPMIVDSLQTGMMPWHPVATSDGDVFVANLGSQTVSYFANGAGMAQTISGNGLAQPHGAVASKSGKIYISGRNINGSYSARTDFGEGSPGTVTVIDASTLQIRKVLEIGAFGSGMAIYEQ